MSRRPFSANVEALIDSLAQHAAGLAGCDVTPCALPADRRIARTTEFDAMAYVPRTSGTRLVQVSAMEGEFPYYGTVETDPAGAWDSAQAGRSAIVDPSLLSALDARIGDTLALGEARFVVTGTIIHIPGDVGIQSVFGPRVFIPAKYLGETKLLGFGARVRYEAFLKLESGMDADEIASQYRSQLRPERVRIRTVQSERRQLDRTLTQFGRFLGLVALMALLLGGLGVASAVHVFVKQKRESIAVLRCLGATAGTVFRTYLSQALAIGLVGSLFGVGLGITVQLLLPAVLRDVYANSQEALELAVLPDDRPAVPLHEKLFTALRQHVVFVERGLLVSDQALEDRTELGVVTLPDEVWQDSRLPYDKFEACHVRELEKFNCVALDIVPRERYERHNLTHYGLCDLPGRASWAICDEAVSAKA